MENSLGFLSFFLGSTDSMGYITDMGTINTNQGEQKMSTSKKPIKCFNIAGYHLKKVKQMNGRDGYMLNADLYLNGVKLAEVVDDGNGGLRIVGSRERFAPDRLGGCNMDFSPCGR